MDLKSVDQLVLCLPFFFFFFIAVGLVIVHKNVYPFFKRLLWLASNPIRKFAASKIKVIDSPPPRSVLRYNNTSTCVVPITRSDVRRALRSAGRTAKYCCCCGEYLREIRRCRYRAVVAKSRLSS